MKTAYIELNSNQHISTISPRQNKSSFSYKGVVYYPNTTVTSLPEILRLNYRYFIRDMGVLTTHTSYEFLRCDKSFLVCSRSKWRRSQIKEKIESLFHHQQNCFTLIMNLTEKESTFTNFFNDYEQLYFPYISNPFQIEPHNFHALSPLLKNL